MAKKGNTIHEIKELEAENGRLREALKETWNCVVGSVISNKIPVFIPCENMKMDYEERIEMIDVCRELARKLRRITDISFRVGIGSVRRLAESMDSYEEALKALVNSTGSVAHVDDLPIQCRYDEEYPIDLENDLFAKLRDGEREECERLAGQYFDWMMETYDEQNMSVKLKTLEFVLWAEHLAYINGGLTYHFQERENYLQAVAEKYHIGFDNLESLVNKFGLQMDPVTEKREKSESGKKRLNSDSAGEQWQKLLLTWLLEKPNIYPQIKKYITEEDFDEGVYKTVAVHLFGQLEQNKLNPAQILNIFQNQEDQGKAAALFNTKVEALEGKLEEEKAVRDIVLKVKQHSIEHLNKTSDSSDVAGLQRILEGKSILQELEKLHISLD